MKNASLKYYRFDNFKLDSKSCSLYYDGRLVESINRKSLEVLTVLLEKPKEIVSHEEIIERVWSDNVSGINSNNVAQYILKLRKILALYQPEKTFIGTGSKRGYIFEDDVFVIENDPPAEKVSDTDAAETGFTESASPTSPYNAAAENHTSHGKNYASKLLPAFLGLLLIAGAVAGALYFSGADEREVRRVVKDSQMYESLILYGNPANLDENELKKYWIDEVNAGDFDISKVRKGVKNLVQKGIYYGRESKNEKFDFVSVEVNESGDFAVAKTIEKWFVAKYRSDGNLLENKTIGPYSVIYNLRKIDGRWLIEKSSTARSGG